MNLGLSASRVLLRNYWTTLPDTSRRERKVIIRLREQNMQRHGVTKEQVLTLDKWSAVHSRLVEKETLGWNQDRREGQRLGACTCPSPTSHLCDLSQAQCRHTLSAPLILLIVHREAL